MISKILNRLKNVDSKSLRGNGVVPLKTINNESIIGTGNIAIENTSENNSLISISGPNTMFPGETEGFFISNYDSSLTYTIDIVNENNVSIVGSGVNFSVTGIGIISVTLAHSFSLSKFKLVVNDVSLTVLTPTIGLKLIYADISILIHDSPNVDIRNSLIIYTYNDRITFKLNLPFDSGEWGVEDWNALPHFWKGISSSEWLDRNTEVIWEFASDPNFVHKLPNQSSYKTLSSGAGNFIHNGKIVLERYEVRPDIDWFNLINRIDYNDVTGEAYISIKQQIFYVRCMLRSIKSGNGNLLPENQHVYSKWSKPQPFILEPGNKPRIIYVGLVATSADMDLAKLTYAFAPKGTILVLRFDTPYNYGYGNGVATASALMTYAYLKINSDNSWIPLAVHS